MGLPRQVTRARIHNSGSNAAFDRFATSGARAPAAVQARRYDEQIDSLRALAVTAVLYSHYAATQDTDVGVLGVRLFFVISGFLITRILLRARFGSPETPRGQILRSFYARRFIRIFPAYYSVILVLMLVPSVRPMIAWHALYATNFYMVLKDTYYLFPAGHFWSLAVEEQYYLVWPLVILFIPRRLIVPLLVTAIIVAIVGREIDYRMKPEGYRYLVLTPYSFDALGLGGLLAVWQQRGTRSALLGRLMKTILLISVASALLISVLRLNVSPPVAYTLTLLPSAALVFGASVGITGIAGKIASFSPLRYVGRISYGIYLWHLPVLAALMKAASMLGSSFFRPALASSSSQPARPSSSPACPGIISKSRSGI